MSSKIEREIVCIQCGHVNWKDLTDEEVCVFRTLCGNLPADEDLKSYYVTNPCKRWKNIQTAMETIAANKVRAEETERKDNEVLKQRELEVFVRVNRKEIEDYIVHKEDYKQWKKTYQPRFVPAAKPVSWGSAAKSVAVQSGSTWCSTRAKPVATRVSTWSNPTKYAKPKKI